MTKSLGIFERTINRCINLINFYISNASSSSNNPPKDIIRGAVVLSVSAFDKYVTDVFAEKIIDYIKKYKIKRTLVKLLEDAGLNVAATLELIKMQRPHRRIRTLIEKHYCKFTTQKFYVIDEIFLKYDISDITSKAAFKDGKKLLKRSVEKLIERRHQIAHNGDYDKYHKIIDIKEDAILRRIKNLKTLVQNMDEIIENRFKQKT